MPKVGKMKFPYTKKGMEEAISYAKQTGNQVNIEEYRGGGLIPKYQRGGRIPGLRQRLGGARPPMQGARRPMEGARPGLGRGMAPRPLARPGARPGARLGGGVRRPMEGPRRGAPMYKKGGKVK